MFETEALKALGSFPLVQAALAILIVIGGYLALIRGTKDKNGGGPSAVVPPWLMMGPAHDAIGYLRQIAEQGRATNHILERIETKTDAMVKEQREQSQLLEDIRNNQELRTDPGPPTRRRTPPT